MQFNLGKSLCNEGAGCPGIDIFVICPICDRVFNNTNYFNDVQLFEVESPCFFKN